MVHANPILAPRADAVILCMLNSGHRSLANGSTAQYVRRPEVFPRDSHQSSRMRHAAIILFSTLCLFAFAAAVPLMAQPAGSSDTGGPPSQRALDGRALAGEIVQAVGGLEVWNDRSWNIAFDFVMMREGKETGRISHYWNRSSDSYIVKGTTKDGRRWEVTFTDVLKKTGSATMDGAPVPDSSRSSMLDMGYGRFINDGYWLLMPFKLLDSAVYHHREEDTIIDGKSYQVLRLSFGNVGLTPGDRYWLYVDPATKLVERWRFHLQSNREGEYQWMDYRTFGSIRLALRRLSADGMAELRIENVQITRNGRLVTE